MCDRRVVGGRGNMEKGKRENKREKREQKRGARRGEGPTLCGVGVEVDFVRPADLTHLLDRLRHLEGG
jgi:hypothetical protein